MLSLVEFKTLVDQMPTLQRAVLQGIGEPLLNRDLPAMIAYLEARGVYVAFNTNAVLLTGRRQHQLIESGLHELRVSLDGSTPETYEKIRGIAAFDRVITNVAALVRLRQARGLSAPRVSFWMTGIRDNLGELPALIDLAADVGADEVYLQRLTYWGEGLAVPEQSIYRGYRGEAEAIIAEAECRATTLGICFRGSDALSPRENLDDRGRQAEPWRSCSRPLRLAYITAQGNALPCCIAPFTGAPYEDLKLGNYLQDGVDAVWHGEAYQEFRRRLYSPEPPASCQHCGLAWSL
jgi:MoaA/NifB/PqqE/SkfB family radical SAM enzyme